MSGQQRRRKLATATAGDVVELAYSVRNDMVESRFLGSVVVTGADGQKLAQLGDPEALIYPRSALKPFQAVASQQMGAGLDNELLAVACGSHSGSVQHQKWVHEILAQAQLTPEDLQCPTAFPSSRAEVAKQAEHFAPVSLAATAVAHQCSGKHAGFLAATRAGGHRLKSYLNPEHPVQQRVTQVLEEYCQTPVSHSGVDGCGAPVAAMSLSSLARGFGRLGLAGTDRSADLAAAQVHHAMLDYPTAVEGPGRSDTEVIAQAQVLCKTGAEGVLGLGAPDGVGVAVKMISGSPRAAHLVGLVILGQFSDAVSVEQLAGLLPTIAPKLTGGYTEVGGIQLAPAVVEVLS